MPSKKQKISLIGAGNIGGTLAYISAMQGIDNVVLLDRTSDFAKGKALDIAQACAAIGIDSNIIGTSNYADIANSDVVIVTAGVPRKPGMSRDDLVSVNTEVIRIVGEGIKNHSPDAFVIVITNPLDAMVWLMKEITGFHPSKVVGMAGVLDSSRFKHFLSEELNVSTKEINTFVLGGHGDTMVPSTRYTTIAGIPITDFVKKGKISQVKLDEIIQRTRDGGAEIVQLLKNGSAFYAPAVSAMEMANSYLSNQRRILPTASYLDGEYGVKGLYIGVPTIISSSGAEVVEIELNAEEQKMFDHSLRAVEDLVNAVKKVL